MSGTRSKALRKALTKDVHFIIYCRQRDIILKARHYRRWLTGYKPL